MERGFTLVEIAIVVLVLGLLLASLLGPLSIRIEQQEIRKTSDQMEEIKEALYGYAMDKEALPCPDTDSPADGLANPPCSGAGLQGWLPWQDLGVDRADWWGSLFRYRVTEAFTIPDNGVCGGVPGDLDLCRSGEITIRTRGYDKPSATVSLVTQIPAVIVSYGKNARGATRALGGAPITDPPAEAADEQENANNNTTFVTRHYTAGDPTCNDNVPTKPYCEFDDIVVWLSANVLKYRLVQAGRLP
ncbi:MAG: prepilin-type N-terminal cleavage/methylation domain-containing protein [Gammaproteobacteria bacterium]